MNKLALTLALTIASASCYADTIGSFATGASSLGNVNSATNFAGFSTSNVISSGTNDTFTLNPGTTWEAAGPHSTWVGYSPTAGPGGTNPPGSLGSPVFYTFTTTFSESGDWHGFLSVAADDTADLFVNGVQVEPDGTVGTDAHCADSVPDCSAFATVNIAGHSGLNTLTFVVEQAGGPTNDPSGLDFSGEVSTVPEPSAFLLVGSGLLLAGKLVRRFA